MTRRLDTLSSRRSGAGRTGAEVAESAYRQFLVALEAHYRPGSAAPADPEDNPYVSLLARAPDNSFDLEALWAHTCATYEHVRNPATGADSDLTPNRGGVLVFTEHQFVRTTTTRRFGFGPKRQQHTTEHLLNLVWRHAARPDSQHPENQHPENQHPDNQHPNRESVATTPDTVPLDIRHYDGGEDAEGRSRPYGDQAVAMLRVARRRGFVPDMVVLLRDTLPAVVLPQLTTYGWPWLTRLGADQRVTTETGQTLALRDHTISARGDRVMLAGYGAVRVFRVPAIKDDEQSHEVWATRDLELSREGLEPYLDHVYAVEHLHR